MSRGRLAWGFMFSAVSGTVGEVTEAALGPEAPHQLPALTNLNNGGT